MKNLRTDPMWDELKYKLTHPETEEEQRAREIKEKNISRKYPKTNIRR